MSVADQAAAAAGPGSLGDPGVLPVGGGLGAGIFPGLGAGLGKSFNLDVGGYGYGGLGYPLLGGLGGFGGYGVPYVPQTPLGSYFGFKGDLIGPIIVIGIILFLVIIVILAIKAAFAWKIDLLTQAKGAKGNLFVRSAAADNIQQEGAQQPEENQLNELAHMVLTAIQSQTCAQKVVCDIGTYARSRDGLSNLLRILEGLVPTSMSTPLIILRDSAEGKYDCATKYPCGNDANDPNNNTVNSKSNTAG